MSLNGELVALDLELPFGELLTGFSSVLLGDFVGVERTDAGFDAVLLNFPFLSTAE